MVAIVEQHCRPSQWLGIRLGHAIDLIHAIHVGHAIDLIHAIHIGHALDICDSIFHSNVVFVVGYSRLRRLVSKSSKRLGNVVFRPACVRCTNSNAVLATSLRRPLARSRILNAAIS